MAPSEWGRIVSRRVGIVLSLVFTLTVVGLDWSLVAPQIRIVHLTRWRLVQSLVHLVQSAHSPQEPNSDRDHH